MKTRYTVALAMLAGSMLGGVAIHGSFIVEESAN
jgi:hypothetical protein